MKFFRYIRKSTEEEDRQILSIESQQESLEQRFPDVEVVRTFVESKSAFKPYNRPAFAEMMERLQNGEADGIIAWDPSRLSRNPIDAGSLIHFLDTGVIKDLKFGTYHFDNSPEGKMMLQFALSQSKYSSDKLSKDVKRGMLKKCANGWRPNLAPTGYMNDLYGLKGEKKVLPDPERFDLVRKMWDMLLSGTYSVSEIRRIANKEWGFTTRKYKKTGGRPLALSAIYNMFTNPFYHGEYEWDGQWYKGNHQAMVTKEEFDRAQLILGRKGKPRPQKHRFALTGLIRCAHCGCMVTAEQKVKVLKKVKSSRLYTYYRCSHHSNTIECHEPAVQQDELHQQVADILETLTIPENLLACTLKYLNDAHEKETRDRSKITSSLQQAYNDCAKRIDNLLALYISPQNSDKSVLTDEEFTVKKQGLVKEKNELGARLQDTDGRLNAWLELAQGVFKFATHAKYWFEHGTIEDKKTIFQQLGQNFLLSDGKLTLELHSPFVAIQKGMEKLKQEFPTFSPISDAPTPLKDRFLQSWSSLINDVRTGVITI